MIRAVHWGGVNAIVHIDFRTILWGGPNEDDSNNLCSAKHSGFALAFFGRGKPLVIGKPAVGGMIYDFWAEFWGRRGAEGTGPWGPHGRSDPVGPLTQRWFASLSPDQQQTALGLIAAKRNAGGPNFCLDDGETRTRSVTGAVP